MKILLLAGADSIHTIRWANAFASLGHDVHLVSMPNHIIRKDKTAQEITIHYLKYPSPYGYYLNALCLRKLFNKIKPDIINVHYASGYGTLVRVSRIHPYVLSVWGSDVYDFPYKNKFNLYTIKKNLANADAIASTSNSMALHTKTLLRDSNREIAVTPFGVDMELFTPSFKPVTKDDKVFLFGSIKKLTYKYGIGYIIKGFGLFLHEWKKNGGIGKVPHLYICGKGDKKRIFEKLIQKLNLQDYVTIEGYIPHDTVAAKFRSFDVSVFGSESESESFGVSAVESMACGTPVIATDVSGFKEVIIDGETGFIVPRGNSKAIAEKMAEFYYKPELIKPMGEKGRCHVLKLYDWKENIKLLESVLLKTKRK